MVTNPDAAFVAVGYVFVSGHSLMGAFFRSAFAMVIAFAVTGCTSVSYYAQSLNGHANIVTARQDVAKLIASPKTPEPLRAKMAAAHAIRQFASAELDLPDNDSYRSYVDIGRDVVTWAVFAAPEFSLTPQAWCFPVFGCVPYRGYFSPKSALAEAEKLKAQGLDVHIGGITAYSTLGWSSDPLLSTMFTQDETYLASLVFHELAHQRVYIKSDTAFNEAFAVAVEVAGVRKWLRALGATAALSRYEADRTRRAEFLGLIASARDDLGRIYSGAGGADEKRAAKAAAIEKLRARYQKLRAGRWHGYRGYDAWFDAPINNARLAAISIYSDQVTEFLRLFRLCSDDFPRFYAAVEQIGVLDKAKRFEALAVAKTCRDAQG